MSGTNLDFSEFDGLFDDLGVTNNATPVPEASITAEQNVTVKPEKNEGFNIQQVNAPLNPNVLQSAQAKMAQIGLEMNQLFVEREYRL